MAESLLSKPIFSEKKSTSFIAHNIAGIALVLLLSWLGSQGINILFHMISTLMQLIHAQESNRPEVVISSGVGVIFGMFSFVIAGLLTGIVAVLLSLTVTDEE